LQRNQPITNGWLLEVQFAKVNDYIRIVEPVAGTFLRQATGNSLIAEQTSPQQHVF
jgi:flagellar biosynthesis/type III secretory pathway chaperone